LAWQSFLVDVSRGLSWAKEQVLLSFTAMMIFTTVMDHWAPRYVAETN
jgi:hypothetical protein